MIPQCLPPKRSPAMCGTAGLRQGVSIPASGAECIPSFNDPNENGKANAAGQFPHSDSCERLARSGLFGLETAHLLLALARQPSIDAAFQGSARPG